MFGLFRSDPASERHRGLTYYLLPLSADGVTVRPIRQLDGEPGFAEVFFDEVFVPDEHVLGGVGEGWKVAMSTTTSERGLTLALAGPLHGRRPIGWSTSTPRRRESDPDAAAASRGRRRTRRGWMPTPTGSMSSARRCKALDGQSIGAESSANKLFWSQLDVEIHETALALLGERATLDADPVSAPWLDGYQFALAGPIYAGTNEVQRNLVAERVLGLPTMSDSPPDQDALDFAASVRELLADVADAAALRAAWDYRRRPDPRAVEAARRVGRARPRRSRRSTAARAADLTSLLPVLVESGRAALPEPIVETLVGPALLGTRPVVRSRRTGCPRVAAGDAVLAVGLGPGELVSAAPWADLFLVPDRRRRAVRSADADERHGHGGGRRSTAASGSRRVDVATRRGRPRSAASTPTPPSTSLSSRSPRS